ncbi:zinc-ribbon domain containing protein [Marinobacter zhejiangensis]|uniref:Probable zinc-ribbon domain-containing protein n=1 Tax=Marinobacter zhejiangensis TaxID=488535 RepID=A0A1I4T2N9_9GAMM|nr:zinc-ribbon domain containing protein [Marinobacter zhejiangensis]SFM70905.1 Probable zinc-ribbon domain-containing protein [Marinobacter zhejiangensis]
MKKIPADKSKWPDELKRSYDYYDPRFDFYYDIKIKCKKCSHEFVWSAEGQKYETEVLKKAWNDRSLCSLCFKRYNLLKESLRRYKIMWLEESENSKSQAVYLKNWLECIREYKKYTNKYDSGMESHLTKLVGKT